MNGFLFSIFLSLNTEWFFTLHLFRVCIASGFSLFIHVGLSTEGFFYVLFIHSGFK